jgi:hypothetical protein
LNRQYPLLYEINTRCWLRELSAQAGYALTLDTVPDSYFDEWKRFCFTHIWLMGVWTSGPRARKQALINEDLRRVYREVLPDWREQDVGGSPYAIADYSVASELGCESGLKQFRERLRAQGMKLVLDFVPNHLGIDHPWISEHPDLFVQAPNSSGAVAAGKDRYLANGKDPYFAPWTDTVQLDYRRSETRTAMTELLLSVAARCDAVRCDMAMLLLKDIFAKTWEAFPARGSGSSAAPLQTEFWADAISTVKRAHPEFVFLAEAYWGTEPRLQALGFDYTYDKTLYDGLVGRDPSAVQRHLLGLPPEVVTRNAHFLENHDERRLASVFDSNELFVPDPAPAKFSPITRGLAEHRAAALLILALPGVRFLHDGQLSGARVKTPVQLIRQPREAKSPEVRKMYEQLLTALPLTAIGQGTAELLPPRPAWSGNPSHQNFVVIQWQSDPLEFFLVVVNLASHRGQCLVWLTIPALASHSWAMKDLLSDERYERSGKDMQTLGLFLDLPAHGAQLFRFVPLS